MSDYSDGSPSTYATLRQPESGPANLADASGYTSTTTQRFRYIIFGEEGYVSPNNRFEGDKFPRLGWKVDRRHLLQNHKEQEGDDASKQGGNNRRSPEAPTHPLTAKLTNKKPKVPTPQLTRKQKGVITTKRRGRTTRRSTSNKPTRTLRAQQGQPVSAQAHSAWT